MAEEGQKKRKTQEEKEKMLFHWDFIITGEEVMNLRGKGAQKKLERKWGCCKYSTHV